MNFNTHSNYEGLHAFLSASKYHWMRYSDSKLIESFNKEIMACKGTELHDFASRCIKLGQKLPKSTKSLNMFINDAIGFRMTSEQMLFYSKYCFGTADAISFNKKLLRIHDFKSGVTPAHMDQLLVYAALFCLEYKIKPGEIEFELRLYQSDEVLIHNPVADEILPIMDTIIRFDKILNNLEMENK